MTRFPRVCVAVVATVLLCGALTVRPVFAQAAPSASRTVYVGPGGSDTTGSGSRTAPYRTIQKAIDAVPSGGTVVLQPGTYRTMVSITKVVTLESESGQSGTSATTIIDATGQPVGILIDGTAAAGTTISGLTVEHANNHGIFVHDSSDVTIENDVITDNGLKPNKKLDEDKAIQLVGTSNSLVADNIVTFNKADGGIGVADDGHVDPGAATPGLARPGDGNTIRGNTVERNTGGCAIVIASYNPGQGVAKNVVTANRLVDNVPGPIVVAADPPGTSATDNVVSDNTVMGGAIAGIIVHSNAPGQSVADNVVTGNTVSGNGADKQVGDMRPTGIVIAGTVGPVSGTRITANAISNEYYGIWQAKVAGTILAANHFAPGVQVPAYTTPVHRGSASKLPKTGADPLWMALGLVLVGCGVLLLGRRGTGSFH